MIIEGAVADFLLDKAVTSLLAAQTIAANRVFPTGDFPTRPELFPVLMVSTPRERKVSINRGVPEFNTVVTLVVVGRVFALVSADAAMVQARQLKVQIETALLCDGIFNQFIQQFITIDTQYAVVADGKAQYAEIAMSFDAEIFQLYQPNTSTPLTDIRATITDGAITNGDTYAVVDVPFSTSP